MKHLLPLILLMALPVRADAQGPTPQELGRSLTADLYEGRVQRIWDLCSPRMKSAMGSMDALQGFRQQVEDQIGKEVEVVSEEVTAAEGLTTYHRLTKFSKTSMSISVKWITDAEGILQGFSIRPYTVPPSDEFLDYETKTVLHLPFTGEWFVYWGGRSRAQNYHFPARDQRFAYDIVIRRDGSSHRGDGKRNEDYYCFEQPILAPAGGVVTKAVDGIADNVPGQMNAAQPTGNHVIIDHGNGEYSFLAHMKNGTVRVEVGQRVGTGDVLGLCGNSGNSSEPHLHYHLQNTAEFGNGDGLPAPFTDYVANGKPVARGEPVKGEVIAPIPPRNISRP